MFDLNLLKTDLKTKMEKALDVLKNEFTGLRTGRASVNLLDGIKVNAYGSETPLNQVSSLSVPDSKTIGISVWDKGLVDAVVKAIQESDLGLNPQNNGTLIRISLPALTEERRKELVKTANTYSEQSKTSIRNIRRDGMEILKKATKDKDISEDDFKRFEENVQVLTDSFIKTIDDMVSKKETDIMGI